MGKIYSFEKLEAYQVARKLCAAIYKVTSGFPGYERFGLSDQIRRAAVSVSSNLAEGSGKSSFKEKAYYTNTSFSSLMEVLCQLQIGLDLNYLDQKDYNEIRKQIEKLSAFLSKLRQYQLKMANP
jgi:four helix bundle protein